MKRLLTHLLPFVVSAILYGCKAEGEYSTWACRFEYNNMIHQDITLAAAMNPDSRGIFCKITESAIGGQYLQFQSSQGGNPTQQPLTEIERQAKFILGINNGIIVGFQTFNTTPYGGFVAYDAQCPNCVRKNNNYLNPRYPLSMSTSGVATCTKCGNQYDLNNNGIIIRGQEGDKTYLDKYLATTTGPYGYITVGTKR